MITVRSVEFQTQFNSKLSYDFIVIGGGASGTIATTELAKKFPNSTILLIERGKSDLETPDTHSMKGWPGLMIENDIIENIRYKDGVWTTIAKVLGGGSSINAGIMGQESEKWFNEAFNFTHEQTDRVKSMYNSLYEEYGHKTILSDLGTDLVNAAEQLGLPNTGYGHGFKFKNSTFQTYSAFDMEKGTRNTTADYLRNAIKRGEVRNVEILFDTNVNRLLITNENQIGAISVQTGLSHRNETKTNFNETSSKILYINKSVVLSAGVIKSVQLLQVSGIGEKEELESAGIPPRINQERVGKEFIDRIVESSAQFSPLNKPLPETPISSISIEDKLLEERTAGSTVSVSFAVLSGGLFPEKERTKVNMDLFKAFIIREKQIATCMNNAMQINVLVANVTSRGTIQSLTPDITDDPEIDPNFLATKEDQENSKKAQDRINDYYNTTHLSKWARKSEEETIECGRGYKFPSLMKSPRTSSYHLFGGITYGKVLNKDFTLKGIDNLYVVDGSIFPRATEINPFNTISAMGGFIAREFINEPKNKPKMMSRVQLQNHKEPDYCIVLGDPIRATECKDKSLDSLMLIQDVKTGEYTHTPLNKRGYFVRSANDDRYCMYHLIGGLTNMRKCSTNSIEMYTYFEKLNSNTDDKSPTYKIRFKLYDDTGPCLLKWWGSETVSGFSCSFDEESRLEWKIKIVDEEKNEKNTEQNKIKDDFFLNFINNN